MHSEQPGPNGEIVAGRNDVIGIGRGFEGLLEAANTPPIEMWRSGRIHSIAIHPTIPHRLLVVSSSTLIPFPLMRRLSARTVHSVTIGSEPHSNDAVIVGIAVAVDRLVSATVHQRQDIL